MNSNLGKLSFQVCYQLSTDWVLCWEVPCINEVDSLSRRIQKLMIVQV